MATITTECWGVVWGDNFSGWFATKDAATKRACEIIVEDTDHRPVFVITRVAVVTLPAPQAIVRDIS